MFAALLQQNEGLVPQILQRLGANARALLQQVQAELDRSPKVSGSGVQVGISPRLRKVLVRAHDEIQQFKLGDQRGKNVLVAFCPADSSPVCKHEFAIFQKALEEIRSYNAEIVGISVDSHYSHRAWAEKLHVTFPLLSDFWPHGAVSQQYGVFQERDGVSERSLFFVD